MKGLLLCINISLFSCALFANENHLNQSEFKDLLENVRSNYKTKNVNRDISELESLVRRHQIDIGEYGLGRGIFDYWRKETSLIEYNSLKNKCHKYKTQFKQEPIKNNLFTSSETLKYKVYGNINLSVISKMTLRNIFDVLKGFDDELVFSEYGNGCESRAHEIARMLDEICIESAKVFVESDKIQLTGKTWWWGYHVAPIVLVNEGQKINPYVLDPSLFGEPVSLTKWLGKLKEVNPKNTYDISLTTKYILMPSDKDLELDNYQTQDLDTVESTLFKRKLLRFIRPFKKSL